MFLVDVEYSEVLSFSINNDLQKRREKNKVKVKTQQSTSVISTNSFPMEMSLIHFSNSL